MNQLPTRIFVVALVTKSCLTLCDSIAHLAPQPMGLSRQEYWSGLPFPSPGDLPNPGIEPGSPTLEADALTSEPPGKPSPLVALLLIFISGIFKKDICVCITDSLCCTPETNMTL